MIYSLSSKYEFVALMACLYLLQGSLFYKFHELVMLFIKHLVNTLVNVDFMEASLVRLKNGDVAIYTPTMDYSCRSNSLEHLSLYEFTSTYKKLLPSNNFYSKSPTFNRLPTL
jgi:hypothetical protein